MAAFNFQPNQWQHQMIADFDAGANTCFGDRRSGKTWALKMLVDRAIADWRRNPPPAYKHMIWYVIVPGQRSRFRVEKLMGQQIHRHAANGSMFFVRVLTPHEARRRKGIAIDVVLIDDAHFVPESEVAAVCRLTRGRRVFATGTVVPIQGRGTRERMRWLGGIEAG